MVKRTSFFWLLISLNVPKKGRWYIIFYTKLSKLDQLLNICMNITKEIVKTACLTVVDLILKNGNVTWISD